VATLLLVLPFPARAAEQLDTVLRQMRAQLEQDQRQIDALKRQLDGFQKRLEQTPVVLPPGVPPPDARNIVVTQQPGNLPGRSVGPPNTASGVGTPGAPQPEAAAPISSARDRIKVSLQARSTGLCSTAMTARATPFAMSQHHFPRPDSAWSAGRVTRKRRWAPISKWRYARTCRTRRHAEPAASGRERVSTIRQAELFVAGLDWGCAAGLRRHRLLPDK
jgi:hypothetical protein